MDKRRIIILGGGLAGLSIAYFLKKKRKGYLLFEKERRVGGLCKSTFKDGFTFDICGHFLHFRHRYTFSLIRHLLGNNLVKYKRSAWIYSFDRFIPYPFQTNLYSLPKRISKECLLDFIEVHTNELGRSKPKNFLEWSCRKFGKSITGYFMAPYNRKFWNIPLKELRFNWADRFVVIPSLKQMISGTVEESKRNLGYHSFFWYPRSGGIEKLIRAFAAGAKNIHLDYEAKEIDLKGKVIMFNNGSKERFDTLISTISLPELAKIIKGLPKDILIAFKKLKWVSIYNMNFGVEGKIQQGRHWIYFPQKDISFFRVGFYHNFSPSPGTNKGSLYIEISYSQDKPIDKRSIVSRAKDDLKRAGILRENARIYCEDINDIKYAYPVYDKNYRLAREKILKFLQKNNIISCGRYGGWKYLSMEDVILQGKEIANKLA